MKGSVVSLAAALGTLYPVMCIVTALSMELYDPIKRSIFVKETTKASQELKKRHDSLDFEFIQSEKGMKILREFFKEVINESEEERRNFLRSFLINAYVKQDFKKTIIDDYWNTLTSLQMIDLRLLNILVDPKKFVSKSCSNLTEDTKKDYFVETEFEKFLDIDSTVLERSVSRLVNNGILNKLDDQYWDRFKNTIENVNVYNNSHFSISDEFHTVILPFGEDFIKFCKLEST